MRDGKFRGGRNLVFGLDRDGVGLGKVSPKVPEADLEKLEAVKNKIADGEIEIPTQLS